MKRKKDMFIQETIDASAKMPDHEKKEKYSDLFIEAGKDFDTRANLPAWIKSLYRKWLLITGKKLGSRAEKYLKMILSNYEGYDIEDNTKNTYCDVLINGTKWEIKSSTLWDVEKKKSDAHFEFQQIRPNQDYQGVLCFGIAPQCLHLYAFTKEYLIDNNITKPQHDPKHGPNTEWFDLKPNESKWNINGGELEKGLRILRKIINDMEIK